MAFLSSVLALSFVECSLIVDKDKEDEEDSIRTSLGPFCAVDEVLEGEPRGSRVGGGRDIDENEPFCAMDNIGFFARWGGWR